MPGGPLRRDPSCIREFVDLATADGFRPSSIEQGRLVLHRYNDFLRTHYGRSIVSAGWREFAAYKQQLMQTALNKTTVRGYLSYIGAYYRLRAQTSQRPRDLDRFTKIIAIGLPRRARSVRWKPFSQDMLRRILASAKAYSRARRNRRSTASEDYAFLMTLAYTGGRAQCYGLRVSEVDFERQEISAIVKSGKQVAIPLHPNLATVLRGHLGRRRYTSEFVFRHGHDPSVIRGQKANRQNAWRICKRVQEAAGLSERVHPHRFRKTLATVGKHLGLDPQYLQAILGHESVSLTLDHYAAIELDDVKRCFAKIDLCRETGTNSQEEVVDLIKRLQSLSPLGLERRWTETLGELVRLQLHVNDSAAPRRNRRPVRARLRHGNRSRGTLPLPGSR